MKMNQEKHARQKPFDSCCKKMFRIYLKMKKVLKRRMKRVLKDFFM